MKKNIYRADLADLPEILRLQYLSYQSEADLFENRDIPPLKQTLEDLTDEYNAGVILKMLDDDGHIIGSVRAREEDGTVHIGKLMIHPQHRCRGYGTMLLNEIEQYFPQKRYELFTSTKSEKNIRFYQKMGYRIFRHKAVNAGLQFVFFEKKPAQHNAAPVFFI